MLANRFGVRCGEPLSGRRFCGTVLSGLIASVLLLTSVVAFAQEETPEEAAARKAAEAAAKVEAERQADAQVFSNLQQQIREFRAREAELLQQQEAEAKSKLAEQQRLTQEQIARRDRAEAHSKELDRQWAANEQTISETTKLLEQHQGNLGELFGVTRQVAGDASGTLRESLLTTQFEPPPGQEERSAFLARLAGAKALPSITELERLWYELLREMTASGKVVRYKTDVLQLENGEATGTAVPTDVVRLGPFTVVNGEDYLGYLPAKESLTELDGQLVGRFREIAGELTHAAPGSGYTKAVVDPASGALLGLYLVRPSWIERVELGEAVGYVIIAVGIIGVLLALFQYAYLLKTRVAVSSQLKDLSRPKADNPLGRLLLAFGGSNGEGHGNGKPPENAEVAELRLSEAVLREVPKLERFQSFLRLAVAAGPLLGLIGTVIGMIITFHAIVASGTSDPTLMARGIGQAMIATVLGLGIAIPLLFINAGLTAFSRGITQVLDEQSDALLAENIRATRKQYDV